MESGHTGQSDHRVRDLPIEDRLLKLKSKDAVQLLDLSNDPEGAESGNLDLNINSKETRAIKMINQPFKKSSVLNKDESEVVNSQQAAQALAFRNFLISNQ